MSEEVITVKVEPPDEFEAKSSDVYQNGLHKEPMDDSVVPSHSNMDKRNFTCLLCDLVFESRDDLRRHLKVTHTSKHYFTMPNPGLHHGRISESLLSSFSSYVNYRYTCTVCGAKFKAFRSYLTHSMSHRGTGSLRSQFDDVRLASILNSGKQHLQDYIDSEDGLPSSFTCDECKTVFSQRDSYAMHMMMRAMNETCMSGMPEQQKTEPNNTEESSDKVSEKSSVSPQSLNAHSESSPSVFSKSLEDVTSKVDQDEYLKSVLDRVFVRENINRLNNVSKNGEEYKLCTFCGSSFEDQDSLAMHVMSDHAEQIIPSKRKSPRIHVPKPEAPWSTTASLLNSNLPCKICAQTFVSRDSLAMHVLAHTQEFSNIGQGMSAMNALKRAQTFDDYTQHRKASRSNDNTDITSGIETVSAIKQENLYCAECDIKFYADSEFSWHNENHHKKDITNTEPLCLTKPSSDLKENNSTTDENRHRVRRNSFSCDENSRSKSIAPRRPLSTGNLTTGEHVNIDIKQEESATDLSKKSEKNVIAPNVNALSTAEQRIIYSVFGKDLRLTPPTQSDTGNTSNSEEKKQRIVKPQRLENKVRPQASKSPLNLSFRHSQSNTVGLSGYPNGDKDGRSLPTSFPKDAAMCRFCDIVFLNKAIYYLHMGLHNVNNQWQCNVCGKVCADAVDFAAHVIHM